MVRSAVSPASIAYLQRTAADPFAESAGAPSTSAPPALRRLLRIHGVSYPRRPGTTVNEGGTDIPTENMLVALAGSGAPVALAIEGGPGGVAFTLGTWAADTEGLAEPHLDAPRQPPRTAA